MSRHEGVSCDVCMKSNFSGRRYKCLICYDFDLCSECHESAQSRNNHNATHAVQCILTRSDHELFYGSEPGSPDHPQALACPFCRQLGFTDSSLHEHVASEHAHAHAEVICPVCAATPHGDPNRMTEDLATHLTMEHVSRRDTTGIEESRAPRRLPHASMRSTTGQLTRGTRGRGASQAAFARDTGSASDPITELLTQLGGMRRASSNYSSTLQQIQQLQQELGRGGAPRRAIVMPGALRDRGGSSGEGPYGELWWDEIASAAGGRPAAIILEDGQTAASVSVAAAIKEELRSRAATQSTAEAAVNSAVASAAMVTSVALEDSGRFLLAKLEEERLTEEARASQEAEMADRSAFVEELFLATLTKRFLDMDKGDAASNDESIVSSSSSNASISKGKDNEREKSGGVKKRAIVQPTTLGRSSAGQSPSSVVVEQNGPIQSVSLSSGIAAEGSSQAQGVRIVSTQGSSGLGRPTARVNPSATTASSVLVVPSQPLTASVSSNVSAVVSPMGEVNNANSGASQMQQATVHPLGNHNANHGNPAPRPLQPVNQQINVGARATGNVTRGRGPGYRASENTPAL